MEKIINLKNKHTKDKKSLIVNTFYEHNAWSLKKIICGIDEVGRGTLAGPVVAAAVVLHPFKEHSLLKDSKLLTEKQRLIAADWIYKNSFYAYGIESSMIVDAVNIYQATKLAMLNAINNLFYRLSSSVANIDFVVIDAMPLLLPKPYSTIAVKSFTFGESQSISIAAASIIAKVKRDQIMQRLNESFPLYDLKNNKGYGSLFHQKALLEKGYSLIHRHSFIKKIIFAKNEKLQKSLF